MIISSHYHLHAKKNCKEEIAKIETVITKEGILLVDVFSCNGPIQRGNCSWIDLSELHLINTWDC